ncbi:MAG: transcription termination/antitermination factor NusG [Candidatus Moranbacteria bacterium]|nr:transcription termination/antitermination factor NusG [Candidatus Moranbacteria bacterium]
MVKKEQIKSKLSVNIGKPVKSKKEAGGWYVIHTYAGYEDSVAKSLRQRIISLKMEDKIFEVLVPTEKQIRIRGGKRKVVEEKIFPGYVLVCMNVNEESWYVVRNTPNVTGFVGTETIPLPLSEAEIKNLKKRMGKDEPEYDIDVAPGDPVKVNDGPFKNFDGKVEAVDRERGKIKVLVNMFSRETPVELDFLQVKKV